MFILFLNLNGLNTNTHVCMLVYELTYYGINSFTLLHSHTNVYIYSILVLEKFVTYLFIHFYFFRFVLQAYPNRDITNIVESSHYQKIGGWCRQGALNANKCKGAHRWIKPFRCLGKFQFFFFFLIFSLTNFALQSQPHRELAVLI